MRVKECQAAKYITLAANATVALTETEAKKKGAETILTLQGAMQNAKIESCRKKICHVCTVTLPYKNMWPIIFLLHPKLYPFPPAPLLYRSNYIYYSFPLKHKTTFPPFPPPRRSNSSLSFLFPRGTTSKLVVLSTSTYVQYNTRYLLLKACDLLFFLLSGPATRHTAASR